MGALAINKELEEKPSSNVFCSFMLGSHEVALPVEMIQEVVNYPELITKVPLSPDFIEGVFSLRGMIIPIANMHILLKSKGEPLPTSKVVIFNFREIKIGLVFDSTSEILKVTSDKICRFDYTDKRSGVVCGALKLEAGARILQIIDPEALFSLDMIPHIVDKIKLTGQTAQGSKLKAQQRKQCISFRNQDLTMAFTMESIQEILKYQELEQGYINYPYSLGLLNLRGNLIPVISLSRFLDSSCPVEENLELKKIMVIQDKDFHRIGLLVDSVEDIISYFESDLLGISNSENEQGNFFEALLKKNEKEVVIFNHESLLSHQEISDIIIGHEKLFQTTNVQNQVKKKIKKQVYISFKIEGKFSLPINEIREIITYPKQLITLPGTKSHISGLYNLRGKVVTVIDMRKLYDLAPYESLGACNIIIVERGQETFGLVVDSIVEIFSVNEDDKLPIPEALATASEKKLSYDIKELVMICDKTTNVNTKLIVLDLPKILQQVSGESH